MPDATAMASAISQLERLRELTLAFAAHLPERTKRKIEACKHSLIEPGSLPQYCRSPFCLNCQHAYRHDERWFVQTRVEQIKQAREVDTYMGTFTVSDCHVTEVRDRAKLLSSAWGNISQKLTRNRSFLVGWHRSLEVVPSGADSSLENVHLHVVLGMARGGYSGRNYISGDRWSELWRSAIGPNHFRSADVHKRDTDTACRYAIKHDPFEMVDQWERDASLPERRIERIEQLKGLNIFSRGGELRPNYTPSDDLVESGLVASRDSGRRFASRFYREMSRPMFEALYRPIPIER
jgi:hypothetical protein